MFWLTILIACMAITGIITAILTTYVNNKKQRDNRGIEGSSYYGAFPNQYSSLPTKDVCIQNSLHPKT